MKKFTFIVGPIAAGKTTLMDKIYNIDPYPSNFFDPNKSKLMIQLYGEDLSVINDLSLAQAFSNAIKDSVENNKDFLMQIHFTTEQLNQINSYLNKYQNTFDFYVHFIGVDDLTILKERANRRELLGGHSSERRSITKSYEQSFKNFSTYLSKFKKTTIWDNTKEYGFNDMEEQLIFENGQLVFQNTKLSEYSMNLLKKINEQKDNKRGFGLRR